MRIGGSPFGAPPSPAFSELECYPRTGCRKNSASVNASPNTAFGLMVTVASGFLEST